MSSFVKMMRSETAKDLHQYPKANHLLNVIAQRASRSDRPLKGIYKGEALISHNGCGLTEQEYRTAKKMLTRWQLCDFRVTDKKTYAKLTNTTVYDLNLEEVNGQVTDTQRTGNGQVTTNKEDKNIRKKEKKENYIKEFEVFWSIYPKRYGGNPKKPAMIKFKKLCATVDPSEIIEGAKKYAAQEVDNVGTKFIAQTITWLNQERWNDDYFEPQSQNPKLSEGGDIDWEAEKTQGSLI